MNAIPQFLSSIRKWACLALLLVMGWQQWVTFASYQDKFSDPVKYTQQVYGKDNVTAYGNRFDEVKKVFEHPAVMCYVGEPVVPNNGTREMHYALTQYYLAPNLLLRNTTARDSVIFNNGASPVTFSQASCDTVIYNLYSSGHINAASNYHINNGWHIIKDFDNGIILLGK